MNGNTDTHGGTEGLQKLVRAFGEALYNDPAEKPHPMPTEDAREVIKAQLTEMTGTHFLDSGSHIGRHWEENTETPPWEQPAWDVQDSWVTHNVYHHMDRVLRRDADCVALEAAMYALKEQTDHYGWGLAQAFSDALRDLSVLRTDVLDPSGIPEEFQATALSVAQEIRNEIQPSRLGRRDGKKPAFKCNTYNQEWHSLSQCLQGVSPAGPYGEVVILQVHQGADIRGGWTGPRVYKTDGWHPHELHYRCERCEWGEAESVLGYDDERLDYRRDRNAVIHTECGGHVHFS